MLTDNAQLLGVYARAYALTGRDLYRRVALETGEYLLREMRGPEGGFFAATDADSEGEEGKYFVWDPSEIRQVLGKGDAEYFCEWYGVREDGNFSEEASGHRTGASILFLSKNLPADAEARLAPMREKLLAARARRVSPALDDKRVAGWNALAVSGLAIAGRILNEVRFLDAARLGARFLLEDCRDSSGRLQRVWKDGAAKIPAFLEDEAFFAHALLDLAEADDEGGPGVWRNEAGAAAASMNARFRRKDGPGFTFSGDGNETLLVNGRDLFDKATPSASGAAAWALARLALETGDREVAREARAAVEEVSWLMARSPHGTESWFFALATLFQFEDKYGLLPSADAAEARRPTVGQGTGDFSSKVNETEAEGATARVEVTSPAGELSVSFPSKHRAQREITSRIALRLKMTDGWHLQGPDGLSIEVSGGSPSEFTFEEISLPAPALLASPASTGETGWTGTFEANLSFLVSRAAAPGIRDVRIVVRYRACGEGACRPEAAISLSVPVEVA